MITSIIFGLFSAVLWGSADVLCRKTSKTIGYYLTSVYIQLIGFCFAVTFALLYDPPVPKFQPNLLLLNILLGIFALVSFTFYYRGLTEGTMSLIGPISGAMAPTVAVLFSVVFLGQAILPTDGFAIAGIILGVVLSGINLSELRNLVPNAILSRNQTIENKYPASYVDMKSRVIKELDSSLIAAGAAGVIYVGLGIIIPLYGWLFPSIIIKASSTLVAFAYLLCLRRKLIIPNLRTFLWLTLMGFLDLMGLVAFNLGLITAGGYIPLVVTFSGLSGLVVLFLARIFYEERLNTIQSLGIFLVIIAAMVLLYFQ
jgi:drug/metabolite transporter (DMT)-like permease